MADISQTPGRRFLIVGLPRSGTTYLMTLLNAHRDIVCSGEQFNPYAIVGVSGNNSDLADVTDRDRAPLYFMQRFFEEAETGEAARVGFKFMLGHNVRILRSLPDLPDLPILYVWRENRLAQVSSLIKAAETKRWAQSSPDDHLERRIKAGPRQISHRWHEFATMDTLFQEWLPSLPQPVLQLEYREMFRDGFEERVCDFLGVAHDPGMRSPLVKQGANTILDRFENPAPIERYFRTIGHDAWLEPEI